MKIMVQEAVRYLASLCDGAFTEDGQGFNRMDAEFGKSLAGQVNWSDKQFVAAQRMLKKYKGQLKAAGYDTVKMFEKMEVEAKDVSPRTRGTQAKKSGKDKKAYVDGKNIKIEFPFNYGTLEVVKSIPGRKFNPTGKFWTAPIAKESVEILSENEFILCNELTVFLAGEKKQADRAKQILEQGVELPKLKKELFPFQKEGVAFIESRNGRALIGDEMGLGKTVQALAWLALHPELEPVILLVPASLKLNWAKEIRETLPEDNPNIQVLHGRTPYPITGKYIIINYDILPNEYETVLNARGEKVRKEIPYTGWVDFLIDLNPQVLIFDEAHYIKNKKAQRTEATQKLAKKIKHTIALTGTLIENRPVEGITIINTIDRTVIPNEWSFLHRFCDAKRGPFGWDFTGASNKEELHEKLTSTIMIRRKKADVLPDMPDKLYSFVPIEMSNRAEYQEAEEDFINYLARTKGTRKAQKAQQAEHLVKIGALRRLALDGKIKQATAWIKDFLEDGEQKLVVFTEHRFGVESLMEEFKDIAVSLDGSTPTELREANVQAFQNDPNVRLFIGNIQAAGVGITLTASSAVAFLELPWTPGGLAQATDRCHRIGQKNTVNVYYLLAENTIDETMAELLDNKRKVLDAILDGKETDETELLTEIKKNTVMEELMNRYREGR